MHLQPKAVVGAIMFGVLAALSMWNFLLFHIIIEMLFLIVMLGIFAVSWYSSEEQNCSPYLYLGGGILTAVLLEFFYAVTYKGLSIFPVYDPNLNSQFWIAARYVESGALFVFSVTTTGKYGKYTILTVSLTIAVALIAWVYSGLFPDCWRDGIGNTPFQTASEVVVVLMMLLAAGLIWRRRIAWEARTVNIMLVAVSVGAAADVALSLANDLQGPVSALGFLLKLLFLVLLHYSIVDVGIPKRWEEVFQSLRQSEADLRRSQEKLHTEEKALRRLKERFELATESTGVAVWERLVENNSILISQTMAIMIGLQPSVSQMEYNLLLELIHPDDVGRLKDSIKEHLAEKTPFYKTDIRFRHPERGYLWFSSRGKVVEKDLAGKPVRIVGTLIDVNTEKKNAKQMKQIQFAIDQSPDAVCFTDQVGKIVYMNQRLMDNYGYTLNDIGHVSIFELIPPGVTEAEWKQAWALLKEKKQMVSQGVIRHSSGAQCPVEIFQSFIDIDGEELICAFAHDVAERNQFQENLKAAKNQAEAANQSKGYFLANMSHEIRTPINVITSMSHLALDTALNPKQRDYMKKIQQAASGLLEIINDILDYSKIEAGKMEIEKLPFDLEDVVSIVSASISALAAEKKIEFILYIDPAVPQKVVGDAGRITQILYNLVNNALKFTEHGEILVSVEVVGWRDEAVDIEFSVMDTGVGITQDVQAKIFDAFVQADASTTRNYGGTGLGLSICRQLTELMGGTIEVSSQAGVGSTFTVCIPFDTETGSISGPQYREISGAVQGLTVLVVDDNDATCRVLNKMLSQMDFGVHIALSGAAALLLLEELKREGKTVDVAIVDKDMPDMNGLETIRTIRQDYAAVAHILLMVTVTDTVEFLKQADYVRIDGMLTKPLSPSALLDGIVGCYGKTASVRGGKDFDDTKLSPPDKIVGARILLVEDHEINRQVAVELLEKAGAKVIVAENGQRALELLESGQEIDLVLMDIQMPVMDGLTATRKIRLLDRAGMNKLPILAMTANAMTGDREKSHESGMNGHIAKPIDPVLLYATIEKWLPAREPDENAVEVKSKVNFDESWEKLAPIAGVDMVAGIDRLGGNTALYAQLLQKLCVNYADTSDTVKKLIESGEMEEARHIAHAVKGVASNLSATAMAESAARLEQVLLENQADSSEELQNFCEMLDVLTKAIFLSLGTTSCDVAEPAPVIREEGSAEALEELLDELKRELQQLRPRPSKELLARIKTFHWQPSQKEQLAAISRHVETYRFEAAETLLETFRSATEKQTQ